MAEGCAGVTAGGECFMVVKKGGTLYRPGISCKSHDKTEFWMESSRRGTAQATLSLHLENEKLVLASADLYPTV